MADCLGMLNRCTQLQRLTLQRCGPIPKAALASLISQPGMQAVVLRGEHGLAGEHASDLESLGARLRCELLLHSGLMCWSSEQLV